MREIFDEINDGNMTVDEGTQALTECIGSHADGLFYDFSADIASSKIISHNAAVAIVNVLSSAKPRRRELWLDFPYYSTDEWKSMSSLSSEIQFIITKAPCEYLCISFQEEPEDPDAEISRAFQEDLFKWIPQNKWLKSIATDDDFLFHRDSAAACQNLTSLSLNDSRLSGDISFFMLSYFLPKTKITHFELYTFPNHNDKVLAEGLAQSQVIFFESAWVFGDRRIEFPLSEAAVKKNRQKFGYMLAFLIFQSLIPDRIEQNFFNSLPWPVFLLILKMVMQPLVLFDSYRNRVINNVKELIKKHKFPEQKPNNRFGFFVNEEIESFLVQQEKNLEEQGARNLQLQVRNEELRGQNAKLSRDLAELKETFRFALSFMPAEALSRLQAARQIGTPVMSSQCEAEAATEPQAKKPKSDDNSDFLGSAGFSKM